jgi:hypothetical protein
VALRRRSGGGVRARERGGPAQRLDELVLVERVDEHACVRWDELGGAADARGDDRPAAGHALEERLAQRLEQARLAEHARARDVLRHLVVRNRSDHDDVV